jgi:CDP-paratose 2-epimerase
VRDILFVDDLLNAYDLAVEKIDLAKGQVYNLGGGPDNVMSIWAEFQPRLEKLIGEPIKVARGDWRPGDQRVFYADITKAEKELDWKPKINVEAGVQKLFEWVCKNKDIFK